MAGEEKPSQGLSPPEKLGFVDISLWVPAADLGDPHQEPNEQMPPVLLHMCPSWGAPGLFPDFLWKDRAREEPWDQGGALGKHMGNR